MRHQAVSRRAASMAAVAVLCVLSSCGTSSSSSQSTTPSTPAAGTSSLAATPTAVPQVCTDVAALKASLVALTKIKPTQDGAAALKSAIANVTTELDAAQASAASSGLLAPEIQQVKTAVAGLTAATDGLSADNVREKAPAIASALVQVATATKALTTAMSEACPGS